MTPLQIVLVSLAVLVVVAVITVGIVLSNKKDNILPGRGKPVPLTLRDPREFFAVQSTDGSIGRDHEGNLCVNNVVTEKGLSSRDDALQYPLRGAVQRNVKTDRWDDVARRAAPLYYETSDVPTMAVVVEGKGTVVRLDDAKLRAKLLVVRHGATLLLCGDKPTLEVEGVLVESGGILQCGTQDAPFTGTLLNIILRTNPLGYDKCGVLASQYSYNWYCPGVKKTDPPTFTDITGSDEHFTNHLGAKSLGVGFCGNLVLHGSVGLAKKVPYRGTWDVRHTDKSHTPWFNPENHFLTFGDNEYAEAYATTFAHLGDGSGVKGQNTITVDGTVRGEALNHWIPGSRILLTCVTRHYAEGKDKPGTLGTPMMWLDYDPDIDQANYDANKDTVEKLINSGSVIYNDEIGCEVAEIASVDAATGTITLKRPLRFHHAWNESTKKAGGAYRAKITHEGTEVEVDTRPHVALLSRNIRIASEYQDAPNSGGAFNRSSTAPETDNPSDYHFKGPGGMLVPDWAKNEAVNKYDDIYKWAYKYRDEGLALTDTDDDKWKEVRRAVRVGKGDTEDPYRYRRAEEIEPVGCWQLGTAGMKGANSILGSQTMFRYGSSTTVDGVELKGLGINGASGNLGQYALHYHLAGWTTAFDEYVEEGVVRDATVVNCSIHQCPSRVVSLHGTNLAQLRNNVSFLTYGSAWFTEEGVERFNVFEHNLAVATMLLRWSDWDNPSKLCPFAAYDFNNGSVFWIKNNQNALVRNIAACCPRPVVGFWPITQRIASAHNMASVCVGDGTRLLPGTAASWCADGGDNSEKYALGIYGHHTNKCWAPESYYLKGYTTKQGCSAQANDNLSAYYRFSDNVGYSILAMMNTYISFYACLPNATRAEPCKGLSRQAYPTTEDAPLWLPKMGLNSCTDEMVVGTYLQPAFAGSSRRAEGLFQPWTVEEEIEFNGGSIKSCCPDAVNCPGRAQGITRAGMSACSRCVPCVFSSCLSFGCSPFVGQTGSAMWSKAQSSWAINCCALTYGAAKGNIPGTSNNVQSATSFVFSVGDDVNKFEFAYMVMHNLITDGAVDLYPVSTIISGEQTLIADSSTWRAGEYTTNKNVSLPHVYFGDGIDHTVVPNAMWANLKFIPGTPIQMFNEDGKKKQLVQNVNGQYNIESVGNWVADNTVKGPYVMDMDGTGGKGRLLRYNSSFQNYDTMKKFVEAEPIRTQIPMEYAVGMFHTDMQIEIGDKICAILATVQTPSK